MQLKLKTTSTNIRRFGTVRSYVDSDFMGDIAKRKSTTGYVFTIVGGVVSWISKLQTVVGLVALCTAETEYMAVTQACN